MKALGDRGVADPSPVRQKLPGYRDKVAMSDRTAGRSPATLWQDILWTGRTGPTYGSPHDGCFR